MDKKQDIASVVTKIGLGKGTVNLKCHECGDPVIIPLDVYNAMLGGKGWKGLRIAYTRKELESQYGQTAVDGMDTHQLNLVGYKVLTSSGSIFCTDKCREFYGQ